jgi:hypothetical protein
VHSASLRPAIVAVLIVVGGGGAFLASALQRTADSLSSSGLAVASQISAMATAATEIGAAQEAYVAPGQPDAPWLLKVGELIQQLTDVSAAIRPSLRSTEAAGHLDSLAGSMQALVQIDGRIRLNLQNGQDLSASDLIFTGARETITSMVTTLRALDADERASIEAERAALGQQAWMLRIVVGGVWALGLALLLRGTRPPQAAQVPAAPVVATAALAAAAPIAVAVDLEAAAAVCTDISRVTTAAALPDLLARAAVVLDAAGIIVWMGAGEELFAVTAHGYDPKILARLGPIGRQADNATAAAWRTGELGTVSGDMMSNGAVVAPMFGVDSCIGVLAAEIRHGREADPSTRAVTAMFAAQLATIVAAWPATSEAAPQADSSSDPIAAAL